MNALVDLWKTWFAGVSALLGPLAPLAIPVGIFLYCYNEKHRRRSHRD